MEDMVLNIVARVAQSDAVVRSQQREEEDLSSEDKKSLLREILHKRPGTFLARFSKFLAAEDLTYFDFIRGDYEVDFYLREARLLLDPVRRERLVKNRRYECMRRLQEEGVYFSDRALYHRQPLLFERYIGQFMNDEEKKALDGDQQAECSLSSHIMFQMEQEKRLRLLERQKGVEKDAEIACGFELFSADEHEVFPAEEQESMEVAPAVDEESSATIGWGELPESKPKVEKAAVQDTQRVSLEEKALLRREFMNIVQQLFLSGHEQDFDYAAVVSNADFDSLENRQLDEEAAYFDSEEPSDALNDEEELTWLRSRASKQGQTIEDGVEEFDEDECDY